MTDTTITIEQLETLATQAEADETAERARLHRLIRAYARILSARDPELYQRQPTMLRDEDGHWDESYPPAVTWRARTSERLIVVRDEQTDDVATTSGAYYEWRRVTTDVGIYIARDGSIWGCEQSGTGRVGSFAAYPGDHRVKVDARYSRRDDVTVSELRIAEAHLRDLAFPASAARAA